MKKEDFVSFLGCLFTTLGATLILMSAFMGLTMGSDFSPKDENMPSYLCMGGVVIGLVGLYCWVRSQEWFWGEDYYEHTNV